VQAAADQGAPYPDHHPGYPGRTYPDTPGDQIMIGPADEQVKLTHHWKCTRPPSITTTERDRDGSAWTVTSCPNCGAQDRTER